MSVFRSVCHSVKSSGYIRCPQKMYHRPVKTFHSQKGHWNAFWDTRYLCKKKTSDSRLRRFVGSLFVRFLVCLSFNQILHICLVSQKNVPPSHKYVTLVHKRTLECFLEHPIHLQEIHQIQGVIYCSVHPASFFSDQYVLRMRTLNLQFLVSIEIGLQ